MRKNGCFYLGQGDYSIAPVPIGEDIHFTPKIISVNVGETPITSGIEFSRYYRPFSGAIKCLGVCADSATAVNLIQGGNVFAVNLAYEDNMMRISHSGLSPGMYLQFHPK